jgi:hypothetical protein
MIKKLLTFVSVFLFVITILDSCRKETPRTFDNSSNVIQDSPATCFNQQFDEGEVNIDCGGNCPACETVNAPCSTTSNQVTQGFSTLNLTTTCLSNSSGDFMLRGIQGSTRVEITFPQEIATTGIWGVETGPAFFDEIGINYFKNGYNHYGTGTGQVYVNVIGTQVSAEFCNVMVAGNEGVFYQEYTLTGKLLCN